MPFENYAEKWTNKLIIQEDIVNASQSIYSDLFHKLGSSVEPLVLVAYIKKRGGYDLEHAVRREEIVGYKLILNSSGRKTIVDKNLDKAIDVPEELFIPEERDKFEQSCLEEFIQKEAESLINEYYYLGPVNFSYKNFIQSEEKEFYPEEDPLYGRGKGVITLLAIPKSSIDELKKYNLFKIFLRRISTYSFTDRTRPDQIDSLLSSIGKQYVDDLHSKFVGDVSSGTKAVSLFDIIHNISLMKYESAENSGKLLFCENGTPVDKIDLVDTISIIDYQSAVTMRKLLETTSEEVSLLCDGERVFAIANSTKGELPEKTFSISFKGQGKWEVTGHNDLELMRVSYGMPRIPREDLNENSFFEKFIETFGSEGNAEKVWSYVEEARHQSHGTLVVITNEETAEEQINSLSNQCFRIVKTDNMSPSVKKGITAIDGALFIDDKGFCHAFGVILDGIANKNIGKISRGARYNSALRFLNKLREINQNGLVVIVSEDKYIEMISHYDLI
jgi:hypothetical protein